MVQYPIFDDTADVPKGMPRLFLIYDWNGPGWHFDEDKGKMDSLSKAGGGVPVTLVVRKKGSEYYEEYAWFKPSTL